MECEGGLFRSVRGGGRGIVSECEGGLEDCFQPILYIYRTGAAPQVGTVAAWPDMSPKKVIFCTIPCFFLLEN